MREKLFRRTGKLLILGVLGVIMFSAMAVHARDPMTFHVLFTGNVTGRVEPSG